MTGIGNQAIGNIQASRRQLPQPDPESEPRCGPPVTLQQNRTFGQQAARNIKPESGVADRA